MKMKKINSVITLALILSLLGHIGVMTYSLWTGWYVYSICKFFPRAALALLLVHILLSIIIFFFAHDGSDLKYARLNIGTILQRATAIIMMIFIHFHMKAYAHVVTGQVLSCGMTAFRMITEFLFFAAALAHIAVSTGKAFITLGLARSEKAIQTINKVSYSICTILLLASALGMLLFYLKGIL